jgi:hypothetical protein
MTDEDLGRSFTCIPKGGKAMLRKMFLVILLIGVCLFPCLLSACRKVPKPTATTLPATSAGTTAMTLPASEATTAAATTMTLPASEATTAATAATTTLPTTTSTVSTTATSTTSSTTAGVVPPVWSVKHTERIFAAADKTVLLKATCDLPLLTNAANIPAFTAINRYFDQQAATAMAAAENLAPQAQDDYTQLKQDFMNWYDERVGKVIWQSDRLASIVVTDDSYYGGAHPNTALSSICFDLKTGLSVPLASFFTISEKEVAELMIKTVYDLTRTLKDETGTYLLYDCSEADVRAAFKPGNFYLNGKEIIIYFQPYDIAPYAAGLPQFPIPYADLADVLKQPLP